MKNIGLLIAIKVTIAATVAGAIAQEATSPQPLPSPAPKPVKRRSFDQFDVSGGIRVGSPAGVGEGVPAAAFTERVDQQTYDGIVRMVEYAKNMELEYQGSEGMVIDPADHFEPYRVLSRKLPALYRIIEMFRAGMLDQPVLTNSGNTGLLNQNQLIIAEMQMISNSTEAQLARNQAKLLPIAERYGAPKDPVEKRPLLAAMFGRLNENFSRLMRQVTVAKNGR